MAVVYYNSVMVLGKKLDTVKNTPPKIHLAVWGVYSSQEDFCPIEESPPKIYLIIVDKLIHLGVDNLPC